MVEGNVPVSRGQATKNEEQSKGPNDELLVSFAFFPYLPNLSLSLSLYNTLFFRLFLGFKLEAMA